MKKTTRLLYWFYKLSWKKLLGVGTFLLMLGAYLPIQQSALQRTRTRSEAALLPMPQPVTEKFETPQGPPKIYLVDHFFGKVGDAVLIHGENLGGLHDNSWVSLAGEKIDTNNLVSWTGSYIEFKVPEKAKSGRIEVSILGQKASWPGVFFVTDETTLTELRFKKNEANANQADLMAEEIKNGKELLVWLLVIKGEGELSFKPLNGISLEQKTLNYPIGKIYELELKLNSQTTDKSVNQLVPLLTVTKTDDQLVGIARGELSNAQGTLKPMKSHPLYVSF